jgi:hypothetical protein
MKVRTYNSQAPIPTGTGAALITNIEGMTNTGESQVWNAAAGLGEVVMQLGQKKMAFDDVMATSESAKILKTAELNFQSKVEKDGNTDNYYKYIEEYQKEVNDGNSKLKWGSPAGRTRAMADISAQAEIFSKQAEVGIIKQKSRDALAVSSSQAIEAIRSDDGTTGGALAAKSALDNLEKALSTVFSPERVEVEMRKIVLKGIIEKRKNVESVIKSQITVAIGDDLDKKKGYELLDSLVKDKVIDVEQNKKIGDWMDDYVSGRKTAQKQDVAQTYMGFAKKLASGQFTGDDIALSNLTVSQKNEWQPILEGKRKEPPVKSSYDGINSTTQILTGYATKELGEIEAIANLSQERYVKQTITDEVYRLAVARIETPYPRHVAEAINGSMKASEEKLYYTGAGFLGKDWIDKSEKEKLSRTTVGLLSWIELESKDGKYPDGEAIYKKVAELGITIEIPNNLPKAKRVIPKTTDDIYITTDEAYDKLSSGTEFYDALFGVRRTKP